MRKYIKDFFTGLIIRAIFGVAWLLAHSYYAIWIAAHFSAFFSILSYQGMSGAGFTGGFLTTGIGRNKVR